MSYDPFPRGPYPVGVRSLDTRDAVRDRCLAIELWYPANESARGQDLVDPTRDRYEVIPGFPAVTQDAVRDALPRGGRYPLVFFSHGFAGHRRQSTFLCTHLASHGYVVAAVDHTGNTVVDVMQVIMQAQSSGEPAEALISIPEFIAARPPDVRFGLDTVLAGGEPAIAPLIDPARIGMSGHSFGGWTTLMVAGRDPRISAALPLAPAGGTMPMPENPLADALELDWPRAVPTLYLVAERDTILPLSGMHDLLANTRPPRRMIVLRNADHMHFCDRIEEVHEMFRMMPPPGAFAEIAKQTPPISELCASEHAYRFTRGLALAHFDAVLKRDEAASGFLTDPIRGLRAQGIDADLHE